MRRRGKTVGKAIKTRLRRKAAKAAPRHSLPAAAKGATATYKTAAPVQQLDLATVIKVSEALSSEIVLDKLINALMRMAIEQAGAERGFLIFTKPDGLKVAAEATTGSDMVAVRLRDDRVAGDALPQSILNYVQQTQETIALDDAAGSVFAADPYFRDRLARSILCLPLTNRGKLVGILYLENNLVTRGVMPSARIPILTLLASQAAIALEHTHLYRELAERERRIRRLVDSNIVGIFTWDLDGRLFEANDAFLRIVGYERDDLLAGRLQWDEMTPPEWRERTAQALDELRITGTVQPYEKEYFRKDGSRVPVLLGSASFDETATHGVSFVLDLTERKQAEETLRRNETYLAAAESLNKMGSWAWRPAANKITHWSQGRYRLFGFDPADGLPSLEAVIERIHPEDRALWLESRSLVARGGESDLDFRIVLPDGGTKHVHAVGRPILNQSGEVVEVMGAAADVTDQKKAQEALRESEELWKAVFENNPTMYFMVDPLTWRILSTNPAGAQQLGYASDELVGQLIDILFPEADRERARKNKALCVERLGQTMSWELRKLRKGGSVIWARETGRAMLVKNRPVVLIVSEDITESKRAAEALREAQGQLAHANRLETLGQLTASIVHEVNQPIGTALNNAQVARRLLRLDPPDLDEAREVVESMIRDCTRAGAVVHRIRELVKRAPRRHDRVEINPLIREVIEFTGYEATKNGITVRTELQEGLPPIQGDRVGLQQVALNLVLNAVEAMSGMSETSRELRIATAQTEAGDVLVAVHDCGPGLAPQIQENMFKAFQTTKLNGLGLGLSICRSIVEGHGGRLWATANAPRGTIFQFALPSNVGERESSHSGN
jgi:PAS domain S-box-containing protein